MRASRVASVVVLAVLPGLVALGDEVHLQNGKTLHGKAFDRGDGWIRVELDAGEVVVPASHVARIVPGPSPAETRARREAERKRVLHARLDATDLRDAQALFRLSGWTREQSYAPNVVEDLLRLVLGADPDHAGARDALGHVYYDNRWMTVGAARQLEATRQAVSMRARGFVLFDGAWMSADEASWRERLEDLDAQLAEARSDLRRTERELRSARGDVDSLHAALSSAVGECESEKSGLEARIDGLQNEVSGLESEVKSLECKVDSLESELGDCESRLRGCESELSSHSCDCG